MTHIMGKEQAKREGWNFDISWKQYLDHILQIDPEERTIVLLLDEEGNHIMELTQLEADQLMQKLQLAIVELAKIKAGVV